MRFLSLGMAAWGLLVAWAASAQHVQHEAGANGASGGTSVSARQRPPPLAMGAAVAPDGALWVVALDAQRRLFVQRSADEGRSWTPPQVLDTGSDKIAADGELRPKIAFAPAGTPAAGAVVVSYTEPLARPYTGQIRLLRSEDGGRSFSAPFTAHQDRQLITHRFESIAFDARGTLHTLWIDKRELEAAIAAAPGAAASATRRGKPAVAYRGAAIYRNESRDGGRSFGPDTKLADHSCECCRIALAPAPDGGLVALWRHVYAPNERDHAFAAVAGAAVTEPVRASVDRWALDACPHHGPGLAPAIAGGYHAVWFGQRAGEARVRYGRLGADGTPQGSVQPLPDEGAEHAAVASAGRTVAIAWRSVDGDATRWRAWVSADEGAHFALRELGRSSEPNDHPLLVTTAQQRILALWRTAGGIRVEPLQP